MFCAHTKLLLSRHWNTRVSVQWWSGASKTVSRLLSRSRLLQILEQSSIIGVSIFLTVTIKQIKFRRFRQFRRYTKPTSSIEKDDLMSLPPLFRGKKFFPLPNGYYNRKVFIKTRSTRNIPRPETRETYHAALPWTMKYFSPMLRG